MTTSSKTTGRTLRYSPEGRTLLIATAKDSAVYGVDPLACDFPGVTAARFTKLGTKDRYDVRCGRTEADSGCECLGHLRRGRCKHVAALAKLVELGHVAAA